MTGKELFAWLTHRKTTPPCCWAWAWTGRDEHRRITRGDNFCLVGGSEETHEKMTETAVKFNEKLSKRGKRLGELSREEFTDLIREASGK